ncbi:hypothetical protein GCM10010218_19780 [Streptomyces mashuensis]|uniref:Uncharacterized protein n=1 Tax=Streptomyces mashuensis TaxID=33904 RepID=A0A919B2I9_9ACTN|nr:hypothetical protein [Streptomyces mashuensis]GHF38636.1 hypothetical protein GCM10010218_19780 [Streptomyces mashuensis]
MIQQYPDELEADLLEHFGIDLLGLWRGQLSLRRISVLIKALMGKAGRSALLAAFDESATWSVQEHLSARISDSLELANFFFLKAHSSESQGLTPPDPIRRPGQPEPAKRESNFASGEELSAFLAGMSNL